MKKLPDWFLLNENPAFHDLDSKTVIEQTARIYGAMQEMITKHNEFTSSMHKAFEDFTSDNVKHDECFKTYINELMLGYIQAVDSKIFQNAEIEEVRKTLIEDVTNEFDTLKNGLVEYANEVDLMIGEHNAECDRTFTMFETRVYNVENDVAQLKQSGGGAGGAMYLHTLKNDDMRFSFYHPQSTAFTVDTLKPYIKNLMNLNGITSLESVIPGSGKFNNTSHQYYGCPIVGIGAMGTIDGAPLCLCGIQYASGKLEQTSVGTFTSFTDSVTKL